MALLQNVSIYACNPVRLMSGALFSDNRSNWNRADTAWNRCYGEAGMDAKYGLPYGSLPPYCWAVPRSSGGIAARRLLTGTGVLDDGNLAAGIYVGSNPVGDGALNGIGGLLAGLVADMLAAGGFSVNPILAGSLPASVMIACSGDVITAAIMVLGPLDGTLRGNGNVSSASLNALVGIWAFIPGITSMAANLAGGTYGSMNSAGLASLAGDLRSKGIIHSAITIGDRPTAFDIAQCILNAQTSDYDLEGTIGWAIGTAGSGGMDPDLVEKIEEIHDEAFGRWVLDPNTDTLTLFKANDDPLKVFNLTRTSSEVPAYIQRTPQ